MSRHPYTHSCDFIRALAGHNQHGAILGRSEASQIRQGIAKAIGMTDEELAIKLSEAQQAKTEDELHAEAEQVLKAMGLR